ncbi:hypothetical protein TNCV_4940741 [Trichonephila clavipes]|nr:hypothetical protein TNCV_4940741 [Trichonephila clavipes]
MIGDEDLGMRSGAPFPSIQHLLLRLGFFAMLPVLGKKAVLEWCMCERRFDWIIVCMSKTWKKYGIERKNGLFDNLPNIPNELISNQLAYDPAVPSSQKRPRALLDHEFINFPQAKRLRA